MPLKKAPLHVWIVVREHIEKLARRLLYAHHVLLVISRSKVLLNVNLVVQGPTLRLCHSLVRHVQQGTSAQQGLNFASRAKQENLAARGQ